jgi:hypothetical protein
MSRDPTEVAAAALGVELPQDAEVAGAGWRLRADQKYIDRISGTGTGGRSRLHVGFGAQQREAVHVADQQCEVRLITVAH